MGKVRCNRPLELRFFDDFILERPEYLLGVESQLREQQFSLFGRVEATLFLDKSP